MNKKYRVQLTDEERQSLHQLTTTGKASARRLTHARILLKADSAPVGPSLTDAAISEVLDVSPSTITRVRQQLVENGLDAALNRQPHTHYRPHRLDGVAEAHLIAIACQTPPQGKSRWTLRLLADQMVELDYVERVSYETVRRTLKKNELKPHLKKRWCIAPQQNATFVWQMEDVLDVYQQPYHPLRPQVCMDETSKQLVGETRTPIEAKAGKPLRYDYEYQRNGVCDLFLFFEPLTGQRYVKVTDTRTKCDWAKCMAYLLEVVYPQAEKVVLVCDNLNTHTPASFYEVFEPQSAKRLADRLEIHYTPKHGSWLNMAEIEFSVVTQQCLSRRIPTKADVEAEVESWMTERNQKGATVDWRFTTKDARIKLKRLYPKIEI